MARVCDGWAGDAQVHFGCPCITNECDESARGGAAHQRVINHDHALALEVFIQRVELHGHTFVAHRLRWLDKCATDITVFDQAVVIGNATDPREANRSRNGRVGYRNDDVGINGCFCGKLFA